MVGGPYSFGKKKSRGVEGGGKEYAFVFHDLIPLSLSPP